MDLMHQYCLEVLGISDPAVLAAPCAKDVYNNFNSVTGHELFEQIGNTPAGIPQEGDIVFWGSGTYGHVAVFVEGSVDSFRSFDQNYPTGSPCHIQNHINYNSVLGWLRFKGHPVADNQALIDQLRAERDTNWNLYQQERDAKINLETQIDQKNKTIGNLEKTVNDQGEDIKRLQASIQSLTDVNVKLDGDNYRLTGEAVKATMDLEICTSQRKEIGKYETGELLTELRHRLTKWLTTVTWKK